MILPPMYNKGNSYMILPLKMDSYMNLPQVNIRIDRHCYMDLPLDVDFSFNLLIKEGLLRGLWLLSILTGIYKSSESTLFTDVSCDNKGQKFVTKLEIYAVYGDNPCGCKVCLWNIPTKRVKVCNNEDYLCKTKKSMAGVNLCNIIPRQRGVKVCNYII